MNDRNKLINLLIKDEGGSREQYLDLLNKIAWHESAHTMNPSIKQIGGGPGRGKYQFEIGKNAGGIVAARRLKQYYKNQNINVPTWLNDITKKDSLDASTLSPVQQDMLFLGNMKMHPKADLNAVFTEEESIPEFWAKYHWAGPKSKVKNKLEDFNESMSTYTGIDKEGPSTIENNNLDIDNNLQELIAEQQQSNTISKDPLFDYLKQNRTQVRDNTNVNSNTNTVKDDFILNEINEGGTHEQNPLGGIPQGIGSNGQTNTVEEGETTFDLPNGKFVFSDRINVKEDNKNLYKKTSSNLFALGGPIDPPTERLQRKSPASPKEYFQNYLRSPKFIERRSNSGDTSPRSTAIDRMNRIEDVEITEQNGSPNMIGQFVNNITDTPYSTNGSVYRSDIDSIIYDKEDSSKLGVPKDQIIAHEYGHAAVDNDKEFVSNLNQFELDNIKSRLNTNKHMSKHDLKPEELKSDLDALRYLYYKNGIYNAGKEDFNEDLLNQIEDNNFIKKRLLKNTKSKEDLIWLMNNIASNKTSSNKNIKLS